MDSDAFSIFGCCCLIVLRTCCYRAGTTRSWRAGTKTFTFSSTPTTSSLQKTLSSTPPWAAPIPATLGTARLPRFGLAIFRPCFRTDALFGLAVSSYHPSPPQYRLVLWQLDTSRVRVCVRGAVVPVRQVDFCGKYTLPRIRSSSHILRFKSSCWCQVKLREKNDCAIQVNARSLMFALVRK
jgi:hypothetical protein